MHATQTTQSEQFTGKLILAATLSEGESPWTAAALIHCAKKAATKQRKEAERAENERRQQERRAEAAALETKAAPAPVKHIEAPVVQSRVCVITHKATPEEAEAIRIAQARKEAHFAKKRLLGVLGGTDFTAKLEALAAEGFEISGQDERGNTIFARDGVTVTLFGSGAGWPTNKSFTRRLNPDEQLAAERQAALLNNRTSQPETPAERARREARRANNRANRIALQPAKGKGGSRDPQGQGKKKGGKK